MCNLGLMTRDLQILNFISSQLRVALQFKASFKQFSTILFGYRRTQPIATNPWSHQPKITYFFLCIINDKIWRKPLGFSLKVFMSTHLGYTNVFKTKRPCVQMKNFAYDPQFILFRPRQSCPHFSNFQIFK